MKDAPREHAPYSVDAPVSAWLSGSQKQTSGPRQIRLDTRAIADAKLGVIEHASLVLERSGNTLVVVYAGTTKALPESYTASPMPVLTLHDQIVLPALVNAHTHLDLTHIGPMPHEPGDGFVAWVDMIRANRANQDDEIARCVRLGIEKSLAGGVIAVGDIAGAPAGRLAKAPATTLAQSPLIGVSFLEFFGIGKTAARAMRRVNDFLDSRTDDEIEQLVNSGIKLGLQPHAPNTVDLSVYRWVTQAAQARSIPLCTHLAETIEERMFIADGIGPQRAMLERFGIWEDAVLEHIAMGKHPIQHLRPVLEMQPYLVAHVNDADDAGIDTLRETQTSVAYCPRASLYFDAERHFGEHRYRDMLDAGVNVCLGTDSIVNLDTPDRISTLDEMRLLSELGDHDAKRLLAMGTINGAKALGLDPDRFTLGEASRPIGLIAISVDSGPESADIWGALMRSSSAPTWLYLE